MAPHIDPSSSSSLNAVVQEARINNNSLSGASKIAWTRLLEIRDGLRAEKMRAGQLRPSDIVNEIFTRLVELCVRTSSIIAQELLTMDDGGADGVTEFDRLASELREYAAEGEYHLEIVWARRLVDENRDGYAKRGRLLGGLVSNPFYRPKLPVESFVYYQNYVDLTRLEMAALFSVISRDDAAASLSLNADNVQDGKASNRFSCRRRRSRRQCPSSAGRQLKVAFVGSGPMPLSSLEFGVQSGGDVARIHNIDSDPEAIRMSVELSEIFSFERRSGGTTSYTFECADIRDVADLRDFDVVHLAALVGHDDAEKAKILEHLHRTMRAGAHLLVRTVHGLRQLLYPRVAMTHLRAAGFDELLEVHPYCGDGVVNSVLIAVKSNVGGGGGGPANEIPPEVAIFSPHSR